MDEHSLIESEFDPQVEAAIQNGNRLSKMQTSVPELMDLSGESEAVKKSYGMDSILRNTRPGSSVYLLADLLKEGFVSLNSLVRGVTATDGLCMVGWSMVMVKIVNQCINQLYGLIRDLRVRMLDDTLVVWSGESYRTPFAQGTNGRDHNPFGFTTWFATGGGIKPGVSVGATDEFGYKAVENKYEIHVSSCKQCYIY